MVEDTITKVLAVIIVVILGIGVGVPIIAGLVRDATTLNSVTNESINLTAGIPAVYNLANDRLSAVTINANNGTLDVTLVESTNYTIIERKGSFINITSFNITNHGGALNYTYTYEGSAYASSAGARTVLAFILLLFVVGVLIFSAGAVKVGG